MGNLIISKLVNSLRDQEDYSASCKTNTGSFAWYDVGPPRATNPGLSGQSKNQGWAYCTIPRLSIGEKETVIAVILNQA